jgi:hypothetical protein
MSITEYCGLPAEHGGDPSSPPLLVACDKYFATLEFIFLPVTLSRAAGIPRFDDSNRGSGCLCPGVIETSVLRIASRLAKIKRFVKIIIDAIRCSTTVYGCLLSFRSLPLVPD